MKSFAITVKGFYPFATAGKFSTADVYGELAIPLMPLFEIIAPFILPALLSKLLGCSIKVYLISRIFSKFHL